MDNQKKEEELTNQFNQINTKINELLTLREQVRGKIMLLQEQNKEQNEETKKEKK